MNEVLAAMPNSNLRPEDETLEEADVVYRQTIMFSATMPPELEKLARKYVDWCSLVLLLVQSLRWCW